MHSSSELSKAWEEEYKKQGIPSSFRKDPTRVVVEFISSLKEKAGKVAADLGCGLGRNSFYLARQGFSVTAIDLVKANADSVNEIAKLEKLPIRAFAQDVTQSWPIAPNSLDIAIDIFCYKHITTKKGQENYRKELAKALKPSGLYCISLASIHDGFYGPLLQASSDNLIVDPYTKISSYLYSMASLEEEFSDHFIVVEANEKTSTSPMHGSEYERKVLNFVFKKR